MGSRRRPIPPRGVRLADGTSGGSGPAESTWPQRLLAAFFLTTGVLYVVRPQTFENLTPDYPPAHLALVLIWPVYRASLRPHSSRRAISSEAPAR